MLTINTFFSCTCQSMFCQVSFIHIYTKHSAIQIAQSRLNELQAFGRYQIGHLRRSSRAAWRIFGQEKTHLDLYNTTLMSRRDTHKPHEFSNNSADSKTQSDQTNRFIYAINSQERSTKWSQKSFFQPLRSRYLIILNHFLTSKSRERSFRDRKGQKRQTFQDAVNVKPLRWESGHLNWFIT